MKEELEEAAKKYLNNGKPQNTYSSFIEGAKYQAERMYSEEEVTQLLIKFNQEIYEVEDVRGWFEQFKKK